MTALRLGLLDPRFRDALPGLLQSLQRVQLLAGPFRSGTFDGLADDLRVG